MKITPTQDHRNLIEVTDLEALCLTFVTQEVAAWIESIGAAEDYGKKQIPPEVFTRIREGVESLVEPRVWSLIQQPGWKPTRCNGCYGWECFCPQYAETFERA